MQSNNPSQRRKMPMMGPRFGTGEKPKNFKKSMKELLRYLKPFSFGLVVALLLAAFGTVFVVVGPKLLGNMTTEVELSIRNGTSINLERIATIGFTLIVLYLLATLFQLVQAFILSKVAQMISKKLRTEISEKINRMPLRYFDKRSYGDVLSIVTNDVDLIGQTLNQSLPNLIVSITSIIGVVIMMITISWQLTLITLVTIPLSSVLMAMVVKFSQKYFITQQQRLGALNGHIEEIYAGHSIVKVFQYGKHAKKEYDKINKQLHESAWKSQFFSDLMRPMMIFVGNISYVAVCVFGGILALNRRIFIGGIQSFFIYVRRLNMPISQIAQTASILQSTAAASERVFEFLKAEEEMLEDHLVETPPITKGNVRFEQVQFGYLPEQTVIRNFNASVKDGQKIAIVGPTGAGKTTLVNLLMRFYDVRSGTITIDGVNIQDIKRSDVRKLFGMVLQDTWTFKGTIAENIAYGNNDKTLEEIKDAARMAYVDHFIESLPDGYNTILEEDSNISQGQKQLLTIARAMVNNAPMLILDEATSSVDTRTEQLIQNAMDQLMQGRTTFVIAHRLSTIKNADLIFVMNEGDIIESGNHEELLEANGFYAKLYHAQFEKSDGEEIN